MFSCTYFTICTCIPKNKYIYIYTYTNTYIYIYTNTHTYIPLPHYLLTYPPTYPPTCPLPTHLATHPSPDIHPSIHLSIIHPYIHLSIHASIHPSSHSLTHPSIHPSTHSPIHPFMLYIYAHFKYLQINIYIIYIQPFFYTCTYIYIDMDALTWIHNQKRILKHEDIYIYICTCNGCKIWQQIDCFNHQSHRESSASRTENPFRSARVATK